MGSRGIKIQVGIYVTQYKRFPVQPRGFAEHFFSVVSWGLKAKSGKAFRPAMALSTGELSGIEGKLVLMTATATRKTIRILTDQFPEVSKWKLLLNLPLRDNVTILVPPQDLIPSSFEITLQPFIDRIKKYGETILIIVRGKESEIPLLKLCFL